MVSGCFLSETTETANFIKVHGGGRWESETAHQLDKFHEESDRAQPECGSSFMEPGAVSIGNAFARKISAETQFSGMCALRGTLGRFRPSQGFDDRTVAVLWENVEARG